MNRQTFLWTLVVFFGASLAFNLINDATEGESTGVRIAAQLAALALMVGVIALFVRMRSK